MNRKGWGNEIMLQTIGNCRELFAGRKEGKMKWGGAAHYLGPFQMPPVD